MITLTQLLCDRSITGLIRFADSLDPNHSWDEWVESDPSITALDLMDAMLDAYDSGEVTAWINRNRA
jgi:hypothetical protein